MACGRAAEAPSGREPAGLYACDSREGRHRGRAQGKQGPGVRPVRRGGAARRAGVDAGIEGQGAADRQAALQVGVAKARAERGDRLWIARAMSSLPVPVSPVISTVESVGATLDTCDRTVRSRGETPTISSNIDVLSISSRRTMFSLCSR